MCTIRFSSSVRPTIDPRSGVYTRSRTRRSYSGVMLVKAAIRYSSLSPSRRAMLPEQVPSLVEPDLDRLEPVVLVGVQPALADAVVELVLLGDQLLDPLVDLGVIHVVEHATGEYGRGARRCDGIHAFWRRRTP